MQAPGAKGHNWVKLYMKHHSSFLCNFHFNKISLQWWSELGATAFLTIAPVDELRKLKNIVCKAKFSLSTNF